MKVDLQDVIEAIEEADDETKAYYLPRTGQIVYDADEEDIEDGIALPDRRAVNDYHNMELFIETVDDDKTAEWLANAIHGRGAFRMFRATLERFGLTENWYDFLDRQHRILAIEWCEDNGIEYETSYGQVTEEEEDEEDYSYGFSEDYNLDRNAAKQKPVEMPKQVRIAPVTSHNSANIVYMYADCRKELAALKNVRAGQDIELAQQEIDEALAGQEMIFAAVKDGRYAGYMILKPGTDLILKDMYVRPDYRRRGIATAMFVKAQEIAAEEGMQLSVVMKPYIEKMLGFLQKQGWNCLDEVRLVRNDGGNDNSVSLLHSRLEY